MLKTGVRVGPEMEEEDEEEAGTTQETVESATPVPDSTTEIDTVNEEEKQSPEVRLEYLPGQDKGLRCRIYKRQAKQNTSLSSTGDKNVEFAARRCSEGHRL